MPERLADAIDELAQPNRPERQEDPQIQAEPASPVRGDIQVREVQVPARVVRRAVGME